MIKYIKTCILNNTIETFENTSDIFNIKGPELLYRDCDSVCVC